MPDFPCPNCRRGLLRPSGNIAHEYSINNIRYEGSITQLLCTGRGACKQNYRLHGEFSFLALVAEFIARSIKVCSIDELRTVANVAYLLSGSKDSATQWLLSEHISPEILRDGATELVEKQLKQLLLSRIKKLNERKKPFAPYAHLVAPQNPAQPPVLSTTAA